jgi:hypothetical protein
MVRTYRRFWHGVLLVVGLIFPALAICTVQAAPLATVSDCSFAPTQGGPGTLVHAYLSQWYSTSPVEVGFAVPITPNEPQGGVLDPNSTTLKPLDRSLATMQTSNGYAETTFRIPAKLSSGKPMPLQSLYLVCMENGQISMGEGAGPALFSFTTGNMPAAGQPLWTPWLPLVMIGMALIIVGVRLRRWLLYSS